MASERQDAAGVPVLAFSVNSWPRLGGSHGLFSTMARALAGPLQVLALLWFALSCASGKAMPEMDFSKMAFASKCKQFRCSEGAFVVPKRKWAPVSHGCNGFGVGFSVTPGEEDEHSVLRSCCDIRHACYKTCGVPKSKCDERMKDCNQNVCASLGGEEKKTCDRDAGMHEITSQLGGCVSYDESQRAACECLPTQQKAKKRRKQVLEAFYAKYATAKAKGCDKLIKKVEDSDKPHVKFSALLLKLLVAYPESISFKPDPRKKKMDEMMKEASRRTKDDGVEASEERESNEEIEDDDRIEL